eukprot:TRINITY_DN37851_c0_g1_i1.p1 TRINITY_DN37851_c0_g1~~TRINITY_DN37851_c0_g1_i1.p1  ORF type:complete len:603 (-),score=86.32 TRINITY_DN37851_c0_g1_i1:257-2065(-)
MDKILAAFEAWDTNDDGVISESELEKVFLELHTPKAKNSTLFASADANADGKIDYCEFLQWIFGDAPAFVKHHIVGPADWPIEPGWLPSDSAMLSHDRRCLTVDEGVGRMFVGGILFPPRGTWMWQWRVENSVARSRSYWEVGILPDGGDPRNDILSIKCAPREYPIETASGIAGDGVLSAVLDFESGSFTVTGANEASGLSCDLKCEEHTPQAMRTGQGDICGKLWQPVLRCARSKGMSVWFSNVQACGRALRSGDLPIALAAGLGDARAKEQLVCLLPGSGGQPGPNVNDIQRVLPADVQQGRGSLFISAGAAATARNLELVEVTAVLRLGTAFPALPESVVVKQIAINDDREADIGARLDECNGFLEENLSSGRNCLVHCGAGVSRSGSAVVAYVMLTQHLCLQDALKFVRLARPWVQPNDAFLLQLEYFQARLDRGGHFGGKVALDGPSGTGPGFSDVQCIRPPTDGAGGLYISGAAGASFRNTSLLNITTVVRLGNFTCRPPREGIDCLTLDLDDSEAAELTPVLEVAVPRALAALGRGQNTLIHCGAGVSRSAAVATAIVMRSQNLDADAALKVVKQAREWAGPNPGFMRQLRTWS